MQAYPVTGANISQTLFKQNERMVVPSDSVSVAYQNLSSLSGINSLPQELNNMQNQMPAYLQQAHLSTWYQDNPWETLMYSKNYGVPPMGGNLEVDQPPGHKPGNTLRQNILPRPPNAPSPYPSVVSELKGTQIMRENFEGGITWN
jgi:hypothetical protein